LEPVPFLNRFIQTGFYLGNRFKVNKKNIYKGSKIKVKFKVFLGKLVPKLFQNRFKNGTSSINRFKNRTGSNKPVPINRFEN